MNGSEETANGITLVDILQAVEPSGYFAWQADGGDQFPWLVFIATIFFLVMVAAVVYVYWKGVHEYKHRKQILESLRRELGDIDATLPPPQWRQQVGSLFSEHAWLEPHYGEYEEQCWEQDDALHNAHQAGEFLGEEQLFPPQAELVQAIPPLLTAIGILGTFMGITIGLGQIEMSGDSAALEKEITSLINSLGLSFRTSIWGLSLSILTNYLLGRSQNGYNEARSKVVRWLDTQLSRGLSQRLLWHLLQSQRELVGLQREREQHRKGAWEQLHRSTEGLLELTGQGREKAEEDRRRTHELLEAQKTSLQDMGETLADAIERAVHGTSGQGGILPAISQMSDRIAKTQQEGVGQMVSDFQENMMTAFGKEFEELRDSIGVLVQANQQYQAAMGGLVDRLDQGTRTQAEVSDTMRATVADSRDTVEQIRGALNDMGRATGVMSEAAREVSTLFEEHGSVLELQRELSGSLIDGMKEQSQQWTTHREAVEQSYQGIQARFDTLAQALQDLTTWHQRIRGALEELVGNWRYAIEEQSALTTRVGEQQEGVVALVSTMERASDRLSKMGEQLDSMHGKVEDGLRQTLKEMGETTSAMSEASKEVSTSFKDHGSVLELQQELSKSILEGMEGQSEQWSVHRHAVEEAYQGIQARFDSLGKGLNDLVSWHDGIKETLAELVDEWKRTIGEQTSLTTKVGDQQDGVLELVSAMDDATTRLSTAAGQLERVQNEVQGGLVSWREDQTRSQEQLRQVSERLAAGADLIGQASHRIQEDSTRTVQHWSRLQEGQSENMEVHQQTIQQAYEGLQERFAGLSESLDALVEWHDSIRTELGAAVGSWREGVAENTSLIKSIHEQQEQVRGLAGSLEQASEAVKQVGQSLLEGSRKLGDGIQGQERAQERLHELAEHIRTGTSEVANVARDLQRQNTQAIERWSEVQSALERSTTHLGSTTSDLQKGMEDYSKEVNAQVKKILTELDGELSGALQNLTSAVSSIHETASMLASAIEEMRGER